MGFLRSQLQDFMKLVFRTHCAGKPAAHFHWLYFVVFYAVIANLPYWIASQEFGFSHRLGWFCTEFSMVGLLALFVPPIFAGALLLSVIAVDMVAGVCGTFYLSIPVSLLNTGVFHALSSPRQHAAVGVVLLVLLMAVFAAYMPGTSIRGKDRWRAATCLIAFAVFCVSVDSILYTCSTGHLPNPLRMSAVADGADLSLSRVPRLARIPIIKLVHLEMIDARTRASEKANHSSTFFVPSATAAAISYEGLSLGKSSQELPNLVIVLVESWGLATDLPLNEALVQPYLQPELRARYEVVQGTVPFHGATIAGEARELCGDSIGFHLSSASANELKGCLPARLTALGYHDIALHGMNGYFFRRSTWYRTIGFQEIWFNDRFRQQGLPDCLGAFIGTCDAAVADWIKRRLEVKSADPDFVHWMTLNSHLPLLVPSILPNGAPCLPAQSLTPRTPLCSWYQLVANVHQSVSQLAMGALARPTIFVIVGDHAPPFADIALQNRFSQTVVPYVLLLPRADHYSSSRILTYNSVIPPGKQQRPSPQTP